MKNPPNFPNTASETFACSSRGPNWDVLGALEPLRDSILAEWESRRELHESLAEVLRTTLEHEHPPLDSACTRFFVSLWHPEGALYAWVAFCEAKRDEDLNGGRPGRVEILEWEWVSEQRVRPFRECLSAASSVEDLVEQLEALNSVRRSFEERKYSFSGRGARRRAFYGHVEEVLGMPVSDPKPQGRPSLLSSVLGPEPDFLACVADAASWLDHLHEVHLRGEELMEHVGRAVEVSGLSITQSLKAAVGEAEDFLRSLRPFDQALDEGWPLKRDTGARRILAALSEGLFAPPQLYYLHRGLSTPP